MRGDKRAHYSYLRLKAHGCVAHVHGRAAHVHGRAAHVRPAGCVALHMPRQHMLLLLMPQPLTLLLPVPEALQSAGADEPTKRLTVSAS